MSRLRLDGARSLVVGNNHWLGRHYFSGPLVSDRRPNGLCELVLIRANRVVPFALNHTQPIRVT